MRRVPGASWWLVVLLAGCGQQAPAPTTPPAANPAPAAAPPPTFSHSIPIGASYDEFNDETGVYVDLGDLLSGEGPRMRADVVATMKGQAPTEPADLLLLSISAPTRDGPGWFETGDTLAFIAGQERAQFPGVQRTHGGDTESLSVGIAPADLTRLLSAAEVRTRVGSYVFVLTEEQREALRDVAYRLANPGAVQWDGPE